jgi:hypothetical protein
MHNQEFMDGLKMIFRVGPLAQQQREKKLERFRIKKGMEARNRLKFRVKQKFAASRLR